MKIILRNRYILSQQKNKEGKYPIDYCQFLRKSKVKKKNDKKVFFAKLGYFLDRDAPDRDFYSEEYGQEIWRGFQAAEGIYQSDLE